MQAAQRGHRQAAQQVLDLNKDSYWVGSGQGWAIGHLAGRVAIGGKHDAHSLVQHSAAVPDVQVLCVLLWRRQAALLDPAGRAVGHADHISEARLLQGELVHLALHNDDLCRVPDIVQAI